MGDSIGNHPSINGKINIFFQFSCFHGFCFCFFQKRNMKINIPKMQFEMKKYHVTTFSNTEVQYGVFRSPHL